MSDCMKKKKWIYFHIKCAYGLLNVNDSQLPNRIFLLPSNAEEDNKIRQNETMEEI